MAGIADFSIFYAAFPFNPSLRQHAIFSLALQYISFSCVDTLQVISLHVRWVPSDVNTASTYGG
jgi:hypothetical protein